MSTDIVFVTYSKDPGFAETDLPVARVLEEQGLSVRAVPWDDDQFSWSDAQLVVLRSCWDYHERSDEFLAWIDSLERSKVRLLNSPETVRWNASKRYLKQLRDNGVVIPDSEFIERGSAASLKEILERGGWVEFVVKPLIGASAHHAWRASKAQLADVGDRFAQQLKEESVVVQCFAPEIAQSGEWSLSFFDGAFSHAVNKLPPSGEWRTQVKVSTQFEARTPPGRLVAEAERVLKLVPGAPLYARIDGFVRGSDFVLMEAEVIEPSFYLNKIDELIAREAATRFANAIMGRLH